MSLATPAYKQSWGVSLQELLDSLEKFKNAIDKAVADWAPPKEAPKVEKPTVEKPTVPVLKEGLAPWKPGEPFWLDITKGDIRVTAIGRAAGDNRCIAMVAMDRHLKAYGVYLHGSSVGRQTAHFSAGLGFRAFAYDGGEALATVTRTFDTYGASFVNPTRIYMVPTRP